MIFVEVYILCGVLLVGTFLYAVSNNSNICGEQVLMTLSPKISVWFREHPVMYHLAVSLFLLLVVLLWPYVMFRIIFPKD